LYPRVVRALQYHIIGAIIDAHWSILINALLLKSVRHIEGLVSSSSGCVSRDIVVQIRNITEPTIGRLTLHCSNSLVVLVLEGLRCVLKQTVQFVVWTIKELGVICHAVINGSGLAC
jgi:hypothetical protein